MKNKLLLFVMFAFIASPVFGQFYFSASPGFNLNSASFGYKINKIVPYAGLQMLTAKFSLDQNDFNWTGTVMQEQNSNVTINGSIIMPTIGAKVFIVEQQKLKAYVKLAITKPFVNAKYSADTDGRVSSGDSTTAANVKEIVKNIKIIGGEVGFGVEYFFDDNFSLGGEFGIRFMKTKFTQDRVERDYDGSGRTVTFKTEAKINVIPTYSKISLNFYFGGGKQIAVD